ncbi:Monothiol glutaredoxin-7 [Pyrenophora seminiperda CCB06]|uniref:Monothiol glutaredoxin-7 n=1 Tax=Pyrenophora seminiperda CCB06 TaxID=1302712 RepID=A0A3M7MDW4_9PLEO|nr:Monothiol glutaredoxin-7 [Pyrenophora seminiperda CCB06]
MPVFTILIVIIIVVLFYMSRATKETQTSDFYTKTQQALQEKEYAQAAKQRDAESVGSRLKAAEMEAKKATKDKDTNHRVAVEGPDSKSVAGRVKMDGERVPGVAQQGGRPRDQAAIKEHETPEEHEVEMELNAILKKSPVIIFSKSYCPHSKKAKLILLQKYTIKPEPYVVELDMNPIGQQLQAFLHKSTGRRTVPNILVMGKSIGGGDDIEELDQTDTLVSTFKQMGGSRITQVEHRGARPEMRRKSKA